MTPQAVPVVNVDDQTLTVELAGRQTFLRVWRQPYDDSWYIAAEQPPGTLITAGRRIQPGQPVPLTAALNAAGRLVCQPTSVEHRHDTLNRRPWGDTHLLQWEPHPT